MSQENYPHVATYINKQLLTMRFAFRLDIINHRDINLLVFHNDRDINFITNIYSDSNQAALQCLHHNIMNIGNIVIVRGYPRE